MRWLNMDFAENKPIYLQIADYVCEQILLNEWQEKKKIPSVRELAITLSVNPNTVIRSYAWLEEMNIITMQRGLGYFVKDKSIEQILILKKEKFFQEELPNLFHKMDLLGIDIPLLNKIYKERNKHEKK